ncbi:MAG: TonB-dependent receptor [Bacteroidales bacterium]|nr:TonB-dependent receptor [Bacteroidales bacterium]
MKIRFLASVILLFLGLSALAQTVRITGTVIDNVGPVIGASVMEKGTSNGAVTDLDGHYAISVRRGAVLQFSSIGYATQEVTVGDRTVIDVTLAEDSEFLDEVVVVGYGTMKRSDLSGASVSMREEDLKGSIITNLDQSLQGRAAGVTAVQTSGAPGSSSSIRVRGQATVNAGAEPLYVIDGVIVQGGGNSAWDYGLGGLGNGKISTISPLATLNPSDIVSMEILKDASATAIYGAQGANGVVLITTRHGRAGESKISYEGMVAVSQQNVRIDMLNLREWAEFYNDFVKLGEASSNPYYADPSLLGVGTNWQDEVFRTALQHQHQVSAQGGNEKVQYYVSGSYMNQEGTVIGTNFDRFSVRTNIDAQVKKWLKVGVNATYAVTNDDLKLADGGEGLIFQSLGTLPDIPVYDIDGNYATVVREGYTSANPVGLAMINTYTLGREKLTGNIYADISPIKHFTWRAEIGFDSSNSESNTFKPTYVLGGKENKTNSMSVQKNASVYWQLKNYLTWSQSFGDHAVTGMLGQECWESRWNYLSASNSNLPDNIVRTLSKATGDPTVGHGFGSSAMASFFTRWTYNYADRYLATYTYRYDGSSNFGPDNRWAGFHSVAASWRFSNEKFFESLRHVVSNGKIRLGWGQTGNSNIGGGAWEATIYDSYSALGDAQRPTNIPNTGVHWEKQEQINLGLDLGFFDNRLSLTVDAYSKRSSDMLMSLDLPSYMGTKGNSSAALAAPKGNFGTIENKGLEITLSGYPIQRRNFEWESNFQISFNQNKLVALDGTENAQLIGYGQWNDIVSVTEIGQPLYGFYGYKVAGVYKDIDDIMNSPRAEKYPADGVFNRSTTVWPGDLKFEDVNKDGVIDENDRTNIGSPLPLFTYGWTNSFRYKNLDLSIFFNGTYGNKVLNYNLMGQGYNGLSHMTSYWTNQQRIVTQRAQLVPKDGVYSDNWYNDVSNIKVANPDTRMPRITTADPNDNDRMSDRYIEDGSYLRIKNITLGYTLPSKLLNKVQIETVRMYVNIQNLYTFTKYTGYDPEVGASTQDATGMTFGVDNGRYPSPTTYSFGLNITF